MKKIQLFLMLISSALLVSCETTTYEALSAPPTNPTYTANIAPVIKANCTGCHGSQFPTLENYAQVKEATLNGDLICRIDQTQACGRVMPQSGPMSRTTIDMIILWQQQGCIN